MKTAVVGASAMERYEDIEGIKQILSEAADFLLPLARETDWPCRPELLGWLTMVRDTFGLRDQDDIH